MCLLQDFRHDASRTTMAYDSGHYVGTVQALVGAYLVHFQHVDPTALLNKFGVNLKTLTPSLLLDGPLMPLTGAAVFAVLGRPPVGGDWQVLVFIEAAFHVIAAMCVYAFATKLAGRRLYGTAAGIAWATYPPAILGCNGFLSEVPVVALSLAYLCSLCAVIENISSDRSVVPFDWRRTIYSVIAGVCAALVVITKPALMFAVLGCVVAFVVCAGLRPGLKIVPLLAMGASVCIIPWACWTHHASGHVYLSARRAPTMNIVKGSDPTTDGWNTLPASDYSALFPESMGPAKALARIITEKPLESINLISRKVERLWTFPWNDFRYDYLKVSIILQTWWHRILLLAGMLGFGAFLMRKRHTSVANFVGWSSLLFVAGHLAYIPFETLSRYGFTAMPFFVVMAAYACYAFGTARLWRSFAALMLMGVAVGAITSTQLLPFFLMCSRTTGVAYGEELALDVVAISILAWFAIKCLCPLAESKKPTRAAVVWVATSSVLALASVCGHLTYADELRDWRCTLKPGWSAVRKIHADARMAKWAILLIDAEQTIASADILVNGKVLPGKIASYFVYDPAHYYLQDYVQTIANLDKKDASNMRQWRAIVVPLDYLSPDGNNEITVRPSETADRVTVYGAYPAPSGSLQVLPSFTLISPSKILRNLDGLETRVTDQTYKVASNDDSVLLGPDGRQSKDLSSAAGKQTGQYRIFLAVGHGPPDAVIPQSASILQSINAAMFGQPRYAGYVVVSAPLDTRIALTTGLQNAKHLRVHMSGQLSSPGADGKLALTITAEGKQPGEGPLLVPGTPCLLPAGSRWTPFDIRADTPTQSLPHGLSGLRLSLIGTGPYGVALRNCVLSVEPVSLPTITVHAVRLY